MVYFRKITKVFALLFVDSPCLTFRERLTTGGFLGTSRKRVSSCLQHAEPRSKRRSVAGLSLDASRTPSISGRHSRTWIGSQMRLNQNPGTSARCNRAASPEPLPPLGTSLRRAAASMKASLLLPLSLSLSFSLSSTHILEVREVILN